MKVAVILPTYNERDNIISLLDSIIANLQSSKLLSLDIIVVDDNSPDGTGEVIKEYKAHHKNVFVVTGQKQGLGRALLRGMSYAIDELRVDTIVQMDADLSHDPKLLPKFIHALEKGNDFVVGSRYIPGGSIPSNWGFHRKLYSVIGNAFVRYGLGHSNVHDWTGGYRAYNKKYVELARNQMMKYSGYVFQIAFLYKAIMNGAHVAEVPIQFIDRRYGRSKIIPSQYIRDIFAYVGSTRLKQLYSHQFFKFCVVGGIGFSINTIFLELFVLLGLHPVTASIIGAECAIISNFYLNNHWTFRSRKIHGIERIHKFIQFNTTSLGAIVIQAGTIAIGTHFFGESEYRIFYLIGVIVGLAWNYLMYSKIIWKNKNS